MSLTAPGVQGECRWKRHLADRSALLLRYIPLCRPKGRPGSPDASETSFRPDQPHTTTHCSPRQSKDGEAANSCEAACDSGEAVGRDQRTADASSRMPRPRASEKPVSASAGGAAGQLAKYQEELPHTSENREVESGGMADQTDAQNRLRRG